MNNYQPVIGLEVHVELNTRSKMFCRCSADYFGKEPNTHTCPVCLGLPGALPYINEEAINSCIKIGLALNCTISEKSLFERKNYFYPDLPKGYQISQYRWPLCVDGWMEVEGKEGKRRIGINRTHQEEDTGKLTHAHGVTLIDYNRSGVPLVEIVTEPDFHCVEQVRDYAKKLQQIFRYLGVSNADMERGDMRLEANVSVRNLKSQMSNVKYENKELPPYRVELKNINSFRFMVAAIEYEIKRQIEALERKISQETRGWNEDKKCTYLQRSKEEAHDYRYFPDPDLLSVEIRYGQQEDLRKQLPKLPQAKVERYVRELGIKMADAKTLVDNKELTVFFEDTLGHGKKHRVSAQEIANFIINKKPDINSVLPAQIIEDILSKKSGIVANEKELERLAREAIEQNQRAASDYKAGKESALQVLVGGVMRLSSGKADAKKALGVLKSLLSF